MKFASWLAGLTHGSVATPKKPRPSALRPCATHQRPGVERLEDRTLLSSFGIGFALGIGSTWINSANGVATDPSGNVLVAGYTGSPSIDLDPGPGTYILSNAGLYNGFAAKYDPAGNLLWGVQESGTGNDKITKVAVDGAGNALIFGAFVGTIDIGAPTTGLAHVTLSNGGSNEWFLAKIDPAGDALWATSIGAAAARWVNAITADAAGNVYATGYEGNRLFVAKYGTDGAAVWTQVVSGVTGKTYNVSGYDVAVDANSNVYVTGSYLGAIDFNPASNQTNWLTSVGYDAFVLKLNANGAYVRAGSMGGRGDDDATGIALDSTGNVHVTGGFTADSKADFDPGIGRLNLPYGGGYVVKLDLNLNAIWGRSSVGGSRKIALDTAGNVYTTGQFSGTIDADPGPGKFNLTAGGEYDAFIIQLNSAGNFVWAGALGGPGSGRTTSYGIAVDGLGNILTVGYFAGAADFDPGLATYSLTSTPDGKGNRSTDAFVSKLVPSTALQAAGGTLILPSAEPHETFAVNLNQGTNAVLADGQSLGTIVDDGVRISISDMSNQEGKKNQTTLFTFTVTLSAAYDQPVTMSYRTVNGTATTNDKDYVARTGTLTFAPGETTKTITITVNGDSKKEANETFYLDLFGLSSNSLFTRNRGIGSILNDD